MRRNIVTYKSYFINYNTVIVLQILPRTGYICYFKISISI